MSVQTLPKFVCAWICTLLLAAANPLSAASPSPKQIDEFMQVSRMQDMFVVAVGTLIDAEVRQRILDLAKTSTLDDAGKKTFAQTVDQRLLPYLRRELAWGNIKPLLHDVFMHSMDSNDVRVVLEFHRSPAGSASRNVTQELLKDPVFLKNAQDPTSQIAVEMIKAKLSPKHFEALQKFNASGAAQRVQSNILRVTPKIMEALDGRLKSHIKTFLAQEFPPS